MLEGINNYPLTWPIGWARTPAHKREIARFFARDKNTNRRHTVAEGVSFVTDELRKLGAVGIIISTNLAVRQDGLPRSGQRRPDDPGTAVYFILKKEPKVLACDHWTTVEDNLWAIGKHVEAMRGQERWGVGTVDQAFAGYEALPAPKVLWWEVLSVSRFAGLEDITASYRALAKEHHPDAGGSQEAFVRIQTAYEQGVKEKRSG